MTDQIVEEVRAARRKHAERFKFDLHAICEDLKKKEITCGHPVKSLPAKKLLKATIS